MKLGDVCDLVNGYAFKSNDYVEQSNTLNCRMSNIRPDGRCDMMYSPKYLPDDFAKKYSDFLLKDGDLIIAMTDMADEPKILGVPTVVETLGFNVLLNQRVGKLILLDDGINPSYLKLLLLSKKSRDFLKKFAGGGLQINIGKKDILGMPIVLPNIEEQNIVVSNIEKIEGLVVKRKQQLRKLDELVKARFVEMFGDPVLNQYKWDIVTIGDVATDVRYGTSLPATECGRYPYLRMNNLTYDGYLDLTDMKYINIPENEIEKCVVRKGDVLFNRTNSLELVGKTCVFDLDEDMVIAGYIIRVRLNDKILPVVLSNYMNTKVLKEQLRSMAKGAVNQANINAQELRSISIYLPPIELQNQFSDFVQQIDKSKLSVQKSLDKLELLKKALMQKYFG